MDHRIATRLDGGTDQVKARLAGCPAAFPDVALKTRAHDVIPGGRPTLGPWYNVVKAEFSRWEPPAAVLTRVGVAGEEVSPVELHLLPVELGEREDPHDPRDNQVKPHRTDPIVLGGLELPLERTKFGPVLEVVRNVAPVLGMHDLRDGSRSAVLLEQECKRPAHTNHP